MALFELHHAVRGRWAAQGARILELSSQNIDGTEPVPVTPQPKTHVNVLQVTFWQNRHVYLERRMTEHEVHACFQHSLHTVGLSHGHYREVDNHRFLLVATKPLRVRHLFKGMLVIRVCHSDFFAQTMVLESFWPYVSAASYLLNNSVNLSSEQVALVMC